MGYQRKELQILGGGFTMLPPGDKAPKTDYLLSQNFRVDQAGKLVSRNGFVQRAAMPGVPFLHTAATWGGNVFWGGAGAAYFGYQTSPIATGFDGNRLGMIPMNNWMWFMNRSKAGRYRPGDGWREWAIEAPTRACVAEPSSSAGAPSASVTYTYTKQNDSNYEHSLTIAGTKYAFLENGYSGGQLAKVISGLASSDRNCTVTSDGYSLDDTAYTVTIEAKATGSIVEVSGSDGNSPARLLPDPPRRSTPLAITSST